MGALASQRFHPGEKLAVSDTELLVFVDEWIGGGGEGDVYRVTVHGSHYALKYFHSPSSAVSDRRVHLRELMRFQCPSAAFLWPLKVVELSSHPGYGYLMPLADTARLRPMSEVLNRSVELDLVQRMRIGLELAQAFKVLHVSGLYYGDISLGNVMFDPEDCTVRMCDNDNIGINRQTPTVVRGTPTFMAPEIVLGVCGPCTSADQHALAVLLFMLLTIAHPLRGNLELTSRPSQVDPDYDLYGTSPLFVFDEDNAANRPVEGIHDNALLYWPLYTSEIRRLFARTFGVGLRHPDQRAQETDWATAFANAIDGAVSCGKCGAVAILDHQVSGVNLKCWQCQAPLPQPLWLDLGSHVVVLTSTTRLHQRHLRLGQGFNCSRVLAKVVPLAGEGASYGLQNRTRDTWRVLSPNGPMRLVGRGETVGIQPGLQISFGEVSGHIERT